MNPSPFKNWICAAASEFIEGLADGFLITTGGSSVAQAFGAVAAIGPKQLLVSMLLAGAWYVASFVKKNPPPFGQQAAPASTSTPAAK